MSFWRTSLFGFSAAPAGEEDAPGAHHELADAPGRVEVAARVLGREALVVVCVAAQHEVGAGRVERLPEGLARG